MGRITLTIHLDYPEGTTVAETSSPPPSLPEPVKAIAALLPTIQPVGEPWPAGECPKHHRPWKDGNYGPFCTAKDDSQQKGFCILRPGALFEGRPAA